ncbi:MAG: hypothetical protein AAF915_30000 [Cyanobacteria bacterium P01_D01_bin.50]
MSEQSPVYVIDQFEVLNSEKYFKKYGIPLAPILGCFTDDEIQAAHEYQENGKLIGKVAPKATW